MSEWTDMQPGVRRRTLASGESMMQMEVTFAAGSQLPVHMHQNEQMTHVVSGRLILTLDGIAHSAEAREDAVVLDTFSPPRFDLLAQDEQQRKEQQDTHA